jgi:acyl-CoA synthetase (AMP-forming)/AMP-acid ligase II
VGSERTGWVSYAQAVHAAPEQFEPARTRWDDPCLGFFTSGTTANPKLVIHQHAWPLAHEGMGRFLLDAGPTDLLWFPADNGRAQGDITTFPGGAFNPRGAPKLDGYVRCDIAERDKPLVWLHGDVKTPPFSRAARLEAGTLLRSPEGRTDRAAPRETDAGNRRALS